MPRKISLNWFMPALVNISVGSFLTTIGAEDTMVCPFDAKKSVKVFLISFEVMLVFLIWCKISFFYRKIVILRDYETLTG